MITGMQKRAVRIFKITSVFRSLSARTRGPSRSNIFFIAFLFPYTQERLHLASAQPLFRSGDLMKITSILRDLYQPLTAPSIIPFMICF